MSESNEKESDTVFLSEGIAAVTDELLHTLADITSNTGDVWMVLKYALVQVETRLELEIADQIAAKQMMTS